MKYALYVRCSTVHNLGGLDSQKDALIRFLKNKGVGEDQFIIYEDRAISGAKESRPALNKLMEEVKNGKIHSVCVASFSRFARSTTQLLSALQLFSELNVSFISLSESIDTNTSIGKMVFTMVSAIAEFERNLVQERVKRGLDTARNKGKILGRPVKHQRSAILALFESGVAQNQIASIVGCNPSTVSRVLHKAINATEKAIA